MRVTLTALLFGLGLMAVATPSFADCAYHQAQAKAQQTAQTQDNTSTQ